MMLCICVLLYMIVPSTTCISMHQTNSTSFTSVTSSSLMGDGDTLYVGGSGPNNYSKIQDAIDNANEGDTVFVYGGIYEENLIVDKSIQLTGENRDTTVIDGGGSGDVVRITADGITLSDFTIQNSGGEEFDFGMEVQSDYNKISGNMAVGQN